MDHPTVGTDSVRQRIALLWMTIGAALVSAGLLNYTIGKVGGGADVVHVVFSAVLTALATAALGLLLWRYIRVSWMVYTAPDDLDERTAEAAVDIGGVQAEADALGSVDPDRAIQFLYMVAYPSTYFDRISESAEPLTRSLSITTTITLTAVGSPGETVLVPVLMRERGSLTDGLRFFVGDDRVSSVSRRRTIAYILAVVRSVIGSWGVNHLFVYRTFGEDRFARVFSSSLPVTLDAVEEMAEWVEEIAPKEKAESARALGDFLRALREEEPLCIPVQLAGTSLSDVDASSAVGARSTFASAGDSTSASADADRRWMLRVLVRRRSILQFHLQRLDRLNRRGESRKSGPRWIDRIRLVFGIRATLIAVPLRNANRARSYHLSLAGLEGTYLARQQLTAVTRASASTSGAEGAPVVDVPLSGRVVARARNGQRHAHLHISGGRNTKQWAFTARYYERMPGSMAPAFASALSVTVLIAMATLAFRGDGSPLFENWEYAALVLAFPSAISLWLGFTPERRLSEGVLAARVSTFATVVLAIIAAGSSIAQEHADLGGWWVGLLIISVVNAAAPFISWMMRAAAQSHFIDAVPRDD